MKITAIKPQLRYQNRVNISIDGKYRFSLELSQLVETGLRVGQELDQKLLDDLEQESRFGKLYARALEYCLSRPHSKREVADYLYRKTIPRRDKNGKLQTGYSALLADRVLERLEAKKYIDEQKFAQFWVDNRFTKKGISNRRLKLELMKKGIDQSIIEQVLSQSKRDDINELSKVIAKKINHYPDQKKLINYLVRQGFSYDDVLSALLSYED